MSKHLLPAGISIRRVIGLACSVACEKAQSGLAPRYRTTAGLCFVKLTEEFFRNGFRGGIDKIIRKSYGFNYRIVAHDNRWWRFIP
ncbi:hypothetical protein [Bacteroides fragilis]|uniref:hypothetical protein n=1 Tax=Bacteroides fragilis TaxID=817 RepID=UPI0021681B3A|nr:hypothetical protein [Bacteroides fragilis]